MKAAGAENVHYVSKATEQGISLEVVGDTGKTSGSQVLEVQKGSTTEELSVLLIGSTGYRPGQRRRAGEGPGPDRGAVQRLPEQMAVASRPATAPLSELVSGLRDAEVAPELEMTGPYTFGGTKMIGGHVTQAIKGTAATLVGNEGAHRALRGVERHTAPGSRGHQPECQELGHTRNGDLLELGRDNGPDCADLLRSVGPPPPVGLNEVSPSEDRARSVSSRWRGPSGRRRWCRRPSSP